jgi:putative PIG3 family NAD(P)H quinone oxidoreductase
MAAQLGEASGPARVAKPVGKQHQVGWIVEGADKIKLAERQIPWPKSGEVLLRIRAFGTCGQDLHQRRARFVAPTSASDILGLEVAGEVVALAPDVTTLQESDYVCCFLTGGGYAEFCSAHAKQCWPMPKGMGWEMAAALPVALCSSWSCLFEHGELKGGQTVLIHGAAGGVGHIMIQVARAFEIQVITTSSSNERAAFCESMGANLALNRSQVSFVEAVKERTLGRGVDVVVDCLGGPTFNDNLQALKIGGRYVLQASEMGSGHVDFQKVIDKRITVTGSSFRSRELAFRNKLVAVVHEHVWPLLEAKAVVPRVQQVFKMSEAPQAIALLEQGRVMGKVVCTVAGELLRADP